MNSYGQKILSGKKLNSFHEIVAMIRGFAFTTIIGICIGVLITRPAFGNIIQHIIKE